MSNPSKGGRGKLAPYTTVHYRIPNPIKLTVERLAGAYKVLAGDENWNGCNKLLEQVNIVIADAVDFDKKEDKSYNQEVQKLQERLNAANEQITQLKAEREEQLSILTLEGICQECSRWGKLRFDSVLWYCEECGKGESEQIRNYEH